MLERSKAGGNGGKDPFFKSGEKRLCGGMSIGGRRTSVGKGRGNKTDRRKRKKLTKEGTITSMNGEKKKKGIRMN